MELWQIASRILFFAVNPHLEMQMVTGRAPGRTHLSDDIPSLYLLPLSYRAISIALRISPKASLLTCSSSANSAEVMSSFPQ